MSRTRTFGWLLTATLISPLLACSEYNLAPLPGYLGKEFFAVDLNNYDGSTTEESADAAQYSVTVSNPVTSAGDASVSITQRGADEDHIQERIAPGDLHVFDLVRFDAEDSFVGERSFYIESTIPVTAHQFNPANNVGVFSNDASMLVPIHSLGKRYRAACWPFDVSQGHTTGLADYLTVVTTEDGTEVQVVPRANVLAGEGVPQTPAGVPMSVTLDESEVLQIQSQGGTTANDLTGSLIDASKPVAVFSGNECAMVPADVWACDHIEEQLHPIEAWGEHYFVVKFEPRGSEADIFRVIADEDGTEVSTEPELPGFPVTLDGGDFIEFESDGEFEVKSSDPVSLIQYMSGSEYTNVPLGSGIGDPAMLVVVPNEQFVDEFIFLTPEGYLEGWITVVAGNNSEVTLDDDPIDDGEWNEFPSGDKRWARIAVEPGVHRLHSDQPMGLTVYGYDDDVSYAYPGGAQLTPQAY